MKAKDIDLQGRALRIAAERKAVMAATAKHVDSEPQSADSSETPQRRAWWQEDVEPRSAPRRNLPTVDLPQTTDSGESVDLLADIRSGDWLDGQVFEPLRYVVPGIFVEGYSVLVGPPKAGKSWLILGTLLAVAAGGAALGHLKTGEPRRVLYLALEDGDRRMQDRCRTLLVGAPIPALFHRKLTVPRGRVFDVIAQWMERFPDTGLVVIDTLGKVLPPAMPGEGAYERDYRIGGQIKRLADDRPGLAVVVLHHDRKATSEDFVDSASGTKGLTGSADTVIVLSRARQSTDGLLRITGRDVIEAEYALTMTDGTWTLDGATLDEAALRAKERAETSGLSGVSTDILSYVRAAGPAGVRGGDVADRFGKDAYQYLRRQVAAGRLTKLGRGIYAPVTSVTSVISGGREHFESDTSDSYDRGLWGDEPPEDES